MRAHSYAAQEKFAEAERDIDYLISQGMADDNVYIQKGGLRAANEDYKGAVEAYKKALEQNPFCVEAYTKEAEAYGICGDNEKAMATYNEAIDCMPESSELLRLRGELKRKTGDEAGAAADFEKAREKLPHCSGIDNGTEFTQMQNRVEDNMRKPNPFGL